MYICRIRRHGKYKIRQEIKIYWKSACLSRFIQRVCCNVNSIRTWSHVCYSATRTSIAFFSMPLLRDLWSILEGTCPLLKEQQAVVARKSRKVRNISQRTSPISRAWSTLGDCFIPQSLVARILSKRNMYIWLVCTSVHRSTSRDKCVISAR